MGVRVEAPPGKELVGQPLQPGKLLFKQGRRELGEGDYSGFNPTVGPEDCICRIPREKHSNLT